MSARSKARKRALDVLYAAEARGVDPLVVLDERMQDFVAVNRVRYVTLLRPAEDTQLAAG